MMVTRQKIIRRMKNLKKSLKFIFENADGILNSLEMNNGKILFSLFFYDHIEEISNDGVSNEILIKWLKKLNSDNVSTSRRAGRYGSCNLQKQYRKRQSNFFQ